MKYKCFLDMDGVLSDFVGGAAKAHGLPNPYLDPKSNGIYSTEKLWGMTSQQFWAPTNSVEFWVGLERTSEADQIVRLVCDTFKPENVAILTAPSLFLSCAGAKRLWIEKNYPIFQHRIILASAATKQFIAGANKMLIDDRDSNCEEWENANGDAILLPRPWNQLYKLNTLEVLAQALEVL
jgi:hypothetical protein